MAIFSGGNNGKSPGLNSLIERVKTREYNGEQELIELLREIFRHRETTPKKVLWMLTSPNPTVRERSIGMITRLAGRHACEILIEAMATSSEQNRRGLAKEIVRTDEQQLLRVIDSMTTSKDVGQRVLAFEIIGAHPKKLPFLPSIRQGLSDHDRGVRLAAAGILSRGSKNPAVRMILIDLLDSEDYGLCQLAIDALAQHPGMDLVEPFFSHMSSVEPKERSRMTTTLSALAGDPNARMEEHVIPVLADEDEEMRNAAVELLTKLPNRTRVLRAYFIHSKGLTTWLRSRAAASILKLSDSLVQPLSELLDDEDVDVRVGAMLMIGESSESSFLPLVIRIFQSDLDWWIRSIAVNVLAKHPSEEVIELLLGAVGDADLRYSILSALGKMDHPHTLLPLLNALDDPSRGLRIAALQALAKKPCETAAERIFVLARDDSERKVRDKAEAVLEEMGPVALKYLEELRNTGQPIDAGTALDIDLRMTNDELNE